jgi:hypothetical protein
VALRRSAALLTEAHRLAQGRLASALAVFMVNLWKRMVRFDDIDATSAAWLEIALPRILAARGQSANLAAAYANNFRAAELEAAFERIFEPLIKVEEDKVRTSLRVTGPVALKHRIKVANRLPDQRQAAEIQKAFVNSGAGAAAAAVRHVGDGGRGTISDMPRQDRKVRGWLRVTSATPCYFCAALASRGPTYVKESFDESDPRFTGDGTAKVHDTCGCSLEPLFFDQAAWPGRGKEFERLWADSTEKASGTDKMLAFRRAYEGRAKD